MGKIINRLRDDHAKIIKNIFMASPMFNRSEKGEEFAEKYAKQYRTKQVLSNFFPNLGFKRTLAFWDEKEFKAAIDEYGRVYI